MLVFVLLKLYSNNIVEYQAWIMRIKLDQDLALKGLKVIGIPSICKPNKQCVRMVAMKEASNWCAHGIAWYMDQFRRKSQTIFTIDEANWCAHGIAWYTNSDAYG